jgi:hypothetical protein
MFTAMAASRAFSIKMFVPNGDPDGLRLIEKSNWTGVGVLFKRSNYKEAALRPEIERTGVYILVGSSDESALPLVYVGEGDPVKDRLAQHQQKKDFWDWAIFFVTKDHSLNKAHVQHLEARLHELAKAAKQCNLENVQCPSPPTLSEADRADTESFLQDVLSVLPLVGLSVFEAVTTVTPSDTQLLYTSGKGVTATGYEDARGFVVCKGSGVCGEETPSMQEWIRTLRKDLLATGVVADNNGALVFTQDHAFTSPSTASAVVLGRNSNGREAWKTKGGITLKELQSASAT